MSCMHASRKRTHADARARRRTCTHASRTRAHACSRTLRTHAPHLIFQEKGFTAEHFMSRDAQNQGTPLGVSLGFVPSLRVSQDLVLPS